MHDDIANIPVNYDGIVVAFKIVQPVCLFARVQTKNDAQYGCLYVCIIIKRACLYVCSRTVTYVSVVTNVVIVIVVDRVVLFSSVGVRSNE